LLLFGQINPANAAEVVKPQTLPQAQAALQRLEQQVASAQIRVACADQCPAQLRGASTGNRMGYNEIFTGTGLSFAIVFCLRHFLAALRHTREKINLPSVSCVCIRAYAGFGMA